MTSWMPLSIILRASSSLVKDFLLAEGDSNWVDLPAEWSLLRGEKVWLERLRLEGV